MDALTRKALQGLVGLFFALAAVLFGLAWTLDWWQAWLFLGVYFACSIALSLWMMGHDRSLVERRMRGGPFAEKEPTQKLIMALTSAGFTGMFVVPAFDHRYGWSHMPVAIVLAGNVLMVLGWYAIYVVFRENSYASATIELAADQKVISTGPYALVRHPMYAGALPMLFAMPIALGSWWGLVPFLVILPALIWRIFDEERFLESGLAGYATYKQKVRYRLIPHLW
ncbi:MAG TPA: isoprenylcysteine carboxylmethyltransferase family protein [Reyranella sp.]|nr:isoprenylcysteine carboxylmethyltransferase family protein [Reyranella sp.]